MQDPYGGVHLCGHGGYGRRHRDPPGHDLQDRSLRDISCNELYFQQSIHL